MADSKLAARDPAKVLAGIASPVPKHKNNEEPRSRSERKDMSKSSGSAGAEPAGRPKKLDFGDASDKAYSPRNTDPETPFAPKQVPQLVAAYEHMQGQETDGEATQRHNKEAEE